MQIKNILVHLDHSQNCEKRLNVAIELCQQNKARLSGLFIIPQYAMPSYIGAQISVDVVAEISEQAIERARVRLSELEQITQKAGVEMKSELLEGALIPLLREYTKYNDLLVLGQYDTEDPEDISYALADTLLMEGACPCLVVPRENSDSTVGKRILLAWNASRESAHALRLALPLLETAQEVVVLPSECANDESGSSGALTQTEHLGQFLESHNINASFSGLGARSGSSSSAILSQASDMNADLIVLGAYGHTRLREIVLGGVTHDLLKQSQVPMFLSH